MGRRCTGAMLLAAASLLVAVSLPATEAYTRPDQAPLALAFRDANINKGPQWRYAFTSTQIGGQQTSEDTELGGPWVCPTPPATSNGSCDPCGANRPDPYWGNFNHLGCRGLAVVPDNVEGASSDIGDGYITDLHITGLHLEGTLPVKEFCMFHYLREFDVDNANFTGQIPDLYCSPTCFNNLVKTDFSYNHLSGTIPPALASTPHLWWLDLGYNQFSGSVPDTFITFRPEKPIQILRLVKNNLSGNLYPLSRAGLQAVSLADNVGLCGMVPAAVRDAHGFNTYNTSLGRPCPGETYPPPLTYASYAWPI